MTGHHGAAPEDRARLSADALAALIATTPPQELVQRLGHLHPDDAAEVMARLPADALAGLEPSARLLHVVEEFADDDAADVIAKLNEDTQEYLLEELTEGETVEALMRYDPQSAGGIMTTDVVTVPAGTTAAAAMDVVRRHVAEDEDAPIHQVYVVDAQRRLLGVLGWRRLVLASPERAVEALATPPEAVVAPTVDQEQVARTMARLNVTAVPVVNEKGVLLGEITFDDVVDVVEAEQTEDMLKFGAVAPSETPYPRLGVARMVRLRAGWLLVLFLGEMATASAMGWFEHEIERAVVLALFIPLIISSGGNSGSQATSLIIRALALGEVQVKDWLRVALRELPASLALGGILGVVGFARIASWQWLGWYDYGAHYLLIALTVAVSLVGVVAFGSLIGSMLPFALKRLGFDPASASAPFVATLVDVTGVVLYFGLAALLLRGTLL